MKRCGSVSELAPAAAKQAVTDGLTAFAAGRWEAAASQFGAAVDQAASGKAAAGQVGFAQQALQLFVAARLLAAAAAAGKSAAGVATAARLARFAVALPMLEEEAEQKVAAVAYAVEVNMAAKNYG